MLSYGGIIRIRCKGRSRLLPLSLPCKLPCFVSVLSQSNATVKCRRDFLCLFSRICAFQKGEASSPRAARSFSSARFSRRDTFRRAYYKRFALRTRFRLPEAEFDDDLFVLGQLHPFDETDQQFPAGKDTVHEALR